MDKQNWFKTKTTTQLPILWKGTLGRTVLPPTHVLQINKLSLISAVPEKIRTLIISAL